MSAAFALFAFVIAGAVAGNVALVVGGVLAVTGVIAWPHVVWSVPITLAIALVAGGIIKARLG